MDKNPATNIHQTTEAHSTAMAVSFQAPTDPRVLSGTPMGPMGSPQLQPLQTPNQLPLRAGSRPPSRPLSSHSQPSRPVDYPFASLTHNAPLPLQDAPMASLATIPGSEHMGGAGTTGPSTSKSTKPLWATQQFNWNPMATPPGEFRFALLNSFPSNSSSLERPEPGRNDGLSVKRLRTSAPKPSSSKNIATPTTTRLLTLPRSLASENQDRQNASVDLINATRQLARPRSTTPGPSRPTVTPDISTRYGTTPQETPQSTEDIRRDNQTDMLGQATRNENQEMMQILYEGGLDDENGPGTHRIYRLMAWMMQKQDTLFNSLKAMNRGRGEPSSEAPPRILPAKPPKEVTWDQSVPYTEPAGRQPRVTRRVLMNHSVRVGLQTLSKQENSKSPLALLLPPDGVNYPTEDEFYLRVNETEASPFNRIAGKVVVSKVVRDWKGDPPLTQAEVEDLRNMTSEHISYLCKCYKNALRENSEENNQARLKRASKASRRATLYHSRLRAIDRFPRALGKHRKLIATLGISGTSSDEEDDTHDRVKDSKVYKIRNRPELSSQVQILKSYHNTPYGMTGGACSIGSASASPDGAFISIITLDHSIVIYPVAHDGPMVNEGQTYHDQQLSGSRPIVPVALMGNNLILRGTTSGEVSILDLSSGPLAPLQTGSGDMVRTLVRYGDKLVVGLSDPTGHMSQIKCYFDTTAPPPREWARIDNDHRVFEVSITDLEATGAIFSAGSKRFLTFDKSEATIATITEEEEAVEATLKEKELDGGPNVDHPVSFDITWVGTRVCELQHKLVTYILALARSRRVWWTLGWIWAFTVILVIDPPQLSGVDRTPSTDDVGFAKGTPSGFAAQYSLQKHAAQMETPGLMFLLYFLGAHMMSRFAWWASWGLELVMLLLGLVLRVLVFAMMLFPGVVHYTQQHLPRFLSRVVCEVMLEFGDFPICAGVV